MITFYNYILFFFNDTATTEIYTLSLHDALPISADAAASRCGEAVGASSICMPASKPVSPDGVTGVPVDRKSTRLNSSHSQISYAVFCLKKKKKTRITKAEHR